MTTRRPWHGQLEAIPPRRAATVRRRDFTVYSEDGSCGGHPDRYVGDDTFKAWVAGVLEVATGGMVIHRRAGWLRVEVTPNQADRPTLFGVLR
jgi:hypothetical protein